MEQAEASMQSSFCCLRQVLCVELSSQCKFLPSGEELFLAGWTSPGGAWFSGQQAAGVCQWSPPSPVSLYSTWAGAGHLLDCDGHVREQERGGQGDAPAPWRLQAMEAHLAQYHCLTSGPPRICWPCQYPGEWKVRDRKSLILFLLKNRFEHLDAKREVLLRGSELSLRKMWKSTKTSWRVGRRAAFKLTPVEGEDDGWKTVHMFFNLSFPTFQPRLRRFWWRAGSQLERQVQPCKKLLHGTGEPD